MQKLIRHNAYFLVPYLLFALTAGTILLLYDKRDIHLQINQHHNNFFDHFFQLMTYLGDGITGLIVGLLLLGIGLKAGATTGLSMVGAAGVTQTLKHTFWSGEPRPKLYFETIHEPLRLVPGVENYIVDSFPSGHSTQAFALCCSLALLVPHRYRWAKALLFVLALLIGYSRMYLSQHFLRDVFFGSLIGTTVTLIVFYISDRFQWIRLPYEKPAEE